eukprot:TRINITY_DN14824_c0_g1_i1.p1 TRINITY_DN14824_c0_g1~~TRINITY_DN14824_c0_g1_i1.p1  ORF type:complete len:617 (+),score=212.80 TRINITY_DN14824_c0_g1_i1:50-1900(+)
MALCEVEERLGKLAANGGVLADSDVRKLVDETEDAHAFLNHGKYDAEVFRSFLKVVVDQLNHKDVHEHTKTRLLLVLNSCAMFRQARDDIFSAIKYIDVNMETSMKVEGCMPFDSELGRMSEHMLVLLCRVQNFKVRAPDVLEFAEGNVQFAVQLLLAILLKEPPYEFELRVNCMTAMLGFSHPATFFSANPSEEVQERALTDFEDKVNHICKLTKRLLVVRVVATAVAPYLLQDGPVLPVVHVACMSIMKFVTNIYNYSTQQATSFRQHVITSTSWVDQVVLPYVCKLIQQIAQSFSLHEEKMKVSDSFNPLQPPPRPCADLPKEVVQGLLVSLRFLALVTFHMGSYGRNIRFINAFTYDLLKLPVEFVRPNIKLYAALLQFNVNIDSLSGEENLKQAQHLPSECSTDAIKSSLSGMFTALSEQSLVLLQQNFHKTTGTLLARDVSSYNVLSDLLQEAIDNQGRAPQVPVVGGDDYRLLGDLPDPSRMSNAQDGGEKAADDLSPVMMDDVLVRPKVESEAHAYVQAEGDAPARFRCALNGHLMKEPVRSPHGHVFEKENIHKWIEQAGQTCPFTGKPLLLSDLAADTGLALEITSWHIKVQAQENEEDELAVYDF